MADINDLVEPIGRAEIEPDGSVGIVNRLAEQLGLTSMGEAEREEHNGSVGFSHFTIENSSVEKLQEDEIREKRSKDTAAYRSSEAPLKHVLIAYYQNLRRIPPDSQSRLSSLLQQRHGTQVYAECNMWLNSQGWGLQHCTLPSDILDLEIISLAMVMEIKKRWGTRNKTRPRNAVYFRDRKVNGETIQVGFLPPMSPCGHPYHPYWLPDPDVGEGYDGTESEEEQIQKAREFLFHC